MAKPHSALTFIHDEAAGGVMLLGAAILALVLANSPLSFLYDALLETPVSIRVGALALDKSLLHWINDGLMAIFFFHVGLEIKRELLVGELSTPRQAALPVIGALGGIIVPALIYIAINWGDAHALGGWAIPTATDIAFAVGVISLVGPRIPPALKVFLLALAIIDDLGAIVIIAVFFTAKLSVTALSLAAIGIVVLGILNSRGVTRIAPYALTGLFIWVCVVKSGVHATLAGVITAFAIPLVGTVPGSSVSPAEHLQDELHAWVNFGVLPAFAFANAGVSLAGVTLANLLSPITLGIAAGLFVGKPLGVFSFTWAAIRAGLGRSPDGTSWLQLFGAAILAGVGFTMSLFIGLLAFPEPDNAAAIRIGVLSGSLVSAIVGFMLLHRAPAPRV
jgi:NhaA family Na+:H+ antiporter